MTDTLICSSAAVPVNPTVWPGSEKDLPTRAETSPLNLSNWLIGQAQGFLSLKTCRVSSAAVTAAAILPDSYRSCADGKSSLPKTAGENAESSPTRPDVSGWRGEYLTLNIPEFPNFQGRFRSDGDVSSLSDILITGSIPPKYYLTAKCAVGILRRAERRGKDLPPILKAALIRQSRLTANA